MKKKIYSIFKIILLVLTVILNIFLIKEIYSLNMIPNKYMLVTLLIYIIVLLINIIFLLSKKLILNILSILVLILLIIISIFGINYSNKLNNFFNKTSNKIIINDYSVVVLKNSNYNKLKDIKDKDLGVISLDENKDSIINKIKSKVDINIKEYNDINKLYEDLNNKEIDSIILSDGFLQILEDNYEDIDNNIKIIYNFKIKNKIENNNNKIDELKPINVLISGSDSRSGQILTLTRSDVNMIMTIDPKNHKILLTSIPRDYYVQLHGTTGLKDKLTHAGIYGIDMSKETLEDVFNIKIDYTVKVGFNSVIQIVDLIGGIDVESDLDFTTSGRDGGAVRTHIVKGNNHLNGAQALSYARERYAYLEGDNHRVQNQQQVLEAIINKISTNKSLLLNSSELLESFSNLYRTDIPNEYIQLVIKEQINNMSSWSIERQQVSGEGAMLETYSMPGRRLWVMIPDYNSVEEARQNIIKIKVE